MPVIAATAFQRFDCLVRFWCVLAPPLGLMAPKGRTFFRAFFGKFSVVKHEECDFHAVGHT